MERISGRLRDLKISGKGPVSERIPLSACFLLDNMLAGSARLQFPPVAPAWLTPLLKYTPLFAASHSVLLP